ncbi:MAG: DNA translocase FtsK [Bacillota bacterium]
MTLSVSQAVAALGCPRYFVLSRRARVRGSPRGTPPRSFPLGRTLHQMVAGFAASLRDAPASLASAFEEGPEAFEAVCLDAAVVRWYEPWLDEYASHATQQDAVGLWEMLAAAVRFVGQALQAHRHAGTQRGLAECVRAGLIASEVPLERVVRPGAGLQLKVTGAADLLVRDARGRQLVVDFKTYPPPDEPLDLFQVALYQWLLEGRGIAAEPVLVYLSPSLVERRFDGAAVAQTLQEKLHPFLAELSRWARWRSPSPPPPPTRLPGLCERCPYHPPCPDVFAVDAGGARARPSALAPTGPGEAAASGSPAPAVSGEWTGSCELPVDRAALERVLGEFRCSVSVTGVQSGPSVVRYLLEPRSETTIRRIRLHAEDLKVRLGLPVEPMVNAEPNAIAVDVARPRPIAVPLGRLLSKVEPDPHPGRLRLPLGVGIGSCVRMLDLGDPATVHLLVAGGTGSGKSTLLLALVAALAARYSPGEVQFVLIDPKQVTFGTLQDSPYLFYPPVTEPDQVLGTLEGVIEEMNGRYRRLHDAGVQSREEWLGSARRASPDVMPHLVCIVDEFADLVSGSRRDRETFEKAVGEIARKGRAAAIHLILATQRPDSTVISGQIKNNFTARVALKVGDRKSSEVVLDAPGAQTLTAPGDMLARLETPALVRLQAPYVNLAQVRQLLKPSPSR